MLLFLIEDFASFLSAAAAQQSLSLTDVQLSGERIKFWALNLPTINSTKPKG